MAENQNNANTDDLTTSDGRKIVSFSAGGESYNVESTEQAARGRKAEIEAEIEELKLQALKRGIKRVKI